MRHETLGAIVGIIAVIAAVVAIETFQWGECRQVGHSRFYCFLRMGSR